MNTTLSTHTPSIPRTGPQLKKLLASAGILDLIDVKRRRGTNQFTVTTGFQERGDGEHPATASSDQVARQIQDAFTGASVVWRGDIHHPQQRETVIYTTITLELWDDFGLREGHHAAAA